MTITQTVEIPASRRVFFDIPPEVPAGKALFEVTVIPFAKKEEKPENKGTLHMSKKELDELLQNGHTPISDSLTGILAHFGSITAEQIREERLAKYLK